MQRGEWISQASENGIVPLKIINVKDPKLGGACGEEAGEAAFWGDLLCVTCVSSEACFLVSCVSPRTWAWDAFQRTRHAVRGAVSLESTVCVLGLWGTQGDLGAGEPGDDAGAPLPRGARGGGWIQIKSKRTRGSPPFTEQSLGARPGARQALYTDWVF